MIRTSRTASIYYLVLSIYALWVMLLPTFPTQDGPMHLYYAHVLQRLLFTPSGYGQYFFIKHVLPPQSVHVYLLAGLGTLVSPEWSEKITALICIFITACGVRFLMRSLQCTESVLSIFAIPLTLTWPLFEGLYSYVLGMGVCLFAVGVWCRAVERPSQKLWVVFIVLTVAMPLVHPLALLFLVIFCCAELAIRSLRERQTPFRSAWELVSIVALSLMCLYVVAFFKPTTERLFTDKSQHSAQLADILSAQFVSPLQGPIAIPLRFALLILALFALRCACFGIVQRLRTKCWRSSDVLLGCSLFLAVLVPFIPFELNGAAFVSQRLIYVVWLGLLCSAEANLKISESQRRGVAVVAAVFALITLFLIHVSVIKAAPIVANVPSIEASGSKKAGILIALSDRPSISSLAFDPLSLSGAKAFIKDDIALLNGPWLRSPSGMLGTRYDALSDENKTHPILLPELLRQSPQLRNDVLSRIDTVVLEGEESQPEVRQEALRKAVAMGGWQCQMFGYYEVCRLPNK